MADQMSAAVSTRAYEMIFVGAQCGDIMVGDLTSARRVETMPGVDDGTTVMEEYYRYHDNPYRYHDNLENLLIHALPRIQDDDHSAV